jgi:SPX domain protein involved in polyphosphate accumulation
MTFRIEEKIPVSPSDAAFLIGYILERNATELYPKRKISSQYFDNERRELFSDSEEGLLPRKKVRIRHYPWERKVESLEIKTSSIEGRYKTSRKLVEGEADRIKKDGLFDTQYGLLKPLVQVEYQREYYAFEGVRITLDSDIEYSFPHQRRQTKKDRWKIVEIKAPIEAGMDFLNNLLPTPRRRFSKYSNAVNELSAHL